MTNVKLIDLYVGKTVYYIPSHCDNIIDNVEAGQVSTINENGVWVRYTTGDTGAKTNLSDLYV